ncbi:MAG: hypothetical protein AAGA77_00635 [Bacteroidota bacterium]
MSTVSINMRTCDGPVYALPFDGDKQRINRKLIKDISKSVVQI